MTTQDLYDRTCSEDSKADKSITEAHRLAQDAVERYRAEIRRDDRDNYYGGVK